MHYYYDFVSVFFSAFALCNSSSMFVSFVPFVRLAFSLSRSGTLDLRMNECVDAFFYYRNGFSPQQLCLLEFSSRLQVGCVCINFTCPLTSSFYIGNSAHKSTHAHILSFLFFLVGVLCGFC